MTAVETEQPPQVRSTAPPVSWAIDVRMCVRNYTRLPDGSIAMHFTPAMPTPQGVMAMPPQITVTFSPEQWEVFKREVGNDGQQSDITIARDLPR